MHRYRAVPYDEGVSDDDEAENQEQCAQHQAHGHSLRSRLRYLLGGRRDLRAGGCGRGRGNQPLDAVEELAIEVPGARQIGARFVDSCSNPMLTHTSVYTASAFSTPA